MTGTALPRHRQHLAWMPLPVAVLTVGLLLRAAVTVWDRLHFTELFNYGNSMSGSLAAVVEKSLAYLGLALTAVLVPILWIGARRVGVAGSRWPGTIGWVCGVLAAFGAVGVSGPPNDGSDPKRLGIVHDSGTPTWVSVLDVVAPYAILIGAGGAVLLLLLTVVVRVRAGVRAALDAGPGTDS
ncbi:hypothetical protein ACGFH8_08320 [Micromonospora sp. NPDC049175]|uniref:hypothetical protein n=1 Tax=Micromonospora sp. NPDC049175 TaxID=3364266 RepID=UPI00371EC4FD